MLGLVQRETGDARAKASFDEALKIFRDIGDRLNEGETLLNLAELPGPPEVQHAYASAALAMARDIAARPQEARALGIIGVSRVAAGNNDQASELLRQAIDLYQEIRVPAPAYVKQALHDLAT